MKYIFSLITIIGLLTPSAYAGESEGQKYQKCMALAHSHETEKLAEAVAYATDWIFGGASGFSGGVPAGHCKAIGLLGLGQAAAAAELLEQLVDDLVINVAPATIVAQKRVAQKNDQLKLELYMQAALAWKAAENYDKSYMAYSAAISSIKQDSPLINNTALLHELYLERGTLQIMRRQYKAAIEDITRAIEKDDQRYEGFLQRAKAFRKKNQLLKARLDLKAAMLLAQDHPDILLERGILYRTRGHKTEARRDWQRIIDLYPKSEYATLAQRNIDLLKLD